MANATVKLDRPEYLADVEIRGGYPQLETEPHMFINAMVFVNGRTVSLQERDVESRRYRQFDRIVEAQVEEGKGNQVIFSGMSERLMAEPYLLRGEDAMVRWQMTPKRCLTC